MPPSKLGSGLRCIPDQKVDLGGAKIARIDPTRTRLEPPSTPFSSTPTPSQRILIPICANAFSTNSRTECGFACRKDVIIRFRVLQDSPHPLDIVARMPPVAPGIEIPEKERLLATELDPPRRRG